MNVQIDSSDMRGSNQKSSKLPHLMAHKSQGKKKKRSNTKANDAAMQEEDGNLFVQSSDAPDLKNEWQKILHRCVNKTKIANLAWF